MPVPTRGPGRSRRPGASVLLPLTLAAVLLTGACASGDAGSGTAPAAPTTTSTPAAPSPDAPAGAVSGATSGSTADAAVPGPTGAVTSTTPTTLRPVRIAVPSIGVDASMVDLGIAGDGSIEVPHDPDQAGWLDASPAPGEQGPAVVAGHVDSTTGPAVFARLSTLEVGDEVVVTRQNGSTATFTVDGVRTYPQDRFPTSQVYGPVPGPALRLITCGGAYLEDEGYQDNVVVYAS
ncbi:class F sortase [Nocardioides sp. AX2bis]|uniref:class F sortase n=1 Tax=Nocardioides sp. AX2bis TaxID=2653157 RepID=UPI0012F35731|nr:class F sortase [Nocardioides sp. AX2bis]VXC04779.1 Class F sortase [Nocardioides sp. AX2bis]